MLPCEKREREGLSGLVEYHGERRSFVRTMFYTQQTDSICGVYSHNVNIHVHAYMTQSVFVRSSHNINTYVHTELHDVYTMIMIKGMYAVLH